MKEKDKHNEMDWVEYLMGLLHKEWERTTAVPTERYILKTEDLPKLKEKIERAVMERQQKMEQENLAFRETVSIDHECYILLRIARHLVFEYGLAQGLGNKEVVIYLDEEECGIFDTLE